MICKALVLLCNDRRNGRNEQDTFGLHGYAQASPQGLHRTGTGLLRKVAELCRREGESQY